MYKLNRICAAFFFPIILILGAISLPANITVPKQVAFASQAEECYDEE